MIRDVCPIHLCELEDTHPADVENGPSVHDTENERICPVCDIEETCAYLDSMCLAHRRPIGVCIDCFYADVEEDNACAS